MQQNQDLVQGRLKLQIRIQYDSDVLLFSQNTEYECFIRHIIFYILNF